MRTRDSGSPKRSRSQASDARHAARVSENCGTAYGATKNEAAKAAAAMVLNAKPIRAARLFISRRAFVQAVSVAEGALVTAARSSRRWKVRSTSFGRRPPAGKLRPVALHHGSVGVPREARAEMSGRLGEHRR